MLAQSKKLREKDKCFPDTKHQGGGQKAPPCFHAEHIPALWTFLACIYRGQCLQGSEKLKDFLEVSQENKTGVQLQAKQSRLHGVSGFLSSDLLVANKAPEPQAAGVWLGATFFLELGSKKTL